MIRSCCLFHPCSPKGRPCASLMVPGLRVATKQAYSKGFLEGRWIPLDLQDQPSSFFTQGPAISSRAGKVPSLSCQHLGIPCLMRRRGSQPHSCSPLASNKGRGGQETDLTSGVGWFLPRTTGPLDRQQRPAKDFPSLLWAPGKAGRKKGLSSRHAVTGLARQEGL